MGILIKKIIFEHLSCLQEKFEKYYLSDINTKQFSSVLKLFHVEMRHVKHLPLNAQEKFAKFPSDLKWNLLNLEIAKL